MNRFSWSDVASRTPSTPSRAPLSRLAHPFAAACVLALGCSTGVSQREFTERVSSGVCERAYACLTADDLANASSLYGRDKAQCRATYTAVSLQGCPAGKSIDSRAVDRCLSDLGALTCSQVKSAGVVIPPFSCSSLCPDVADPDAGTPPDARKDDAAPATSRDAFNDGEPTEDGADAGADAIGDADQGGDAAEQPRDGAADASEG